uniref:NADH-ubiquinone oxidoreductase chain 6 n=1 Tax=Calonectria ilicicola TaxID=182845 RepID=A0A6G7MXN8_9HYPO|nr:NADH dehydrogenase subunit 6 [Calonectria ilicicola]QIJ45863.1 NADH dehydrogenase subunit 6 [Calonectria ilicicola]QIJ45890.1 NADH dehydrogenase subunit 6 [Calonectria ilicicola]QIJ45984.1 NADH dehydrogenase subunit 6 [Calonectria ilicicola]QIQ23116.1 NADH dehydrogenase subunit 6 [Calonectria ilicicola]
MEMDQLITIYEIFSNGYLTSSLDVISVMALLCGIAIIINKNPIISIIFLIGLFASISVYLILLGLTFIGLSYLIVYIGAVSILFLFILMLINIRTSELQSNNKNSIPLGLFITLLTNFTLFQSLPYFMAILNNYSSKLNTIIYYLPWNKYIDIVNYINKNANINSANVMFVSSNSWDGNMAETSHISALGNILYTSYNMWIFMASFILLLAMVGAIIITIKSEKSQV